MAAVSCQCFTRSPRCAAPRSIVGTLGGSTRSAPERSERQGVEPRAFAAVKMDLGIRTWTPTLPSTSCATSTSQATLASMYASSVFDGATPFHGADVLGYALGHGRDRAVPRSGLRPRAGRVAGPVARASLRRGLAGRACAAGCQEPVQLRPRRPAGGRGRREVRERRARAVGLARARRLAPRRSACPVSLPPAVRGGWTGIHAQRSRGAGQLEPVQPGSYERPLVRQHHALESAAPELEGRTDDGTVHRVWRL